MDSEEVLILSVENSAECLCLGKRKDKGKHAADPSKKQSKKMCRARDGKARDNCLVILDGGSDSGDDYIEVYGEKDDKGCLTHVDSAADDKDILESVVNGPKVLELSALCEENKEPVVVMKESEIRAKRTKPQCPPISLLSAELTKADPDPVSVFPDSTNHHLPVTNDLSTYWPGQHVAGAQNKAKTKADEVDSTSTLPKLGTNLGAQLHRTPTCWTNCPNCPPNKKSKYHLIDVAYNCPEWSVVSTPLTQAKFTVNRVQRIQNESLWERLCYEKQLMLRDRPDVNEQLLYHTSRSTIAVICEEGLDLRLSRNGMFGSGIYFSDSPVKCNHYWGGGVSATRYMFCCRVLLGEVKEYPNGRSEQLRREPPKTNPRPGETKFFDSVKGNLSGQNEYVVYNAYRVMPEYVLRYSLNHPSGVQTTAGAMPLSHPSMYNLSIHMARGVTMAPGSLPMAIGGVVSRPRKKAKRGSRKKY